MFRFPSFLLALACLLPCAAPLPAATATEKQNPRQESAGGIRHSLLITGSTGTYLYDEDSRLIWETPGASHDGYVLENGNVLVSVDNEAREFRAGSQEIVWSSAWRMARP